MQKKDFLDYIHHFRGLAILFIVGLHACVTLNWGDRLMQRKAMIILFNNGTVLFVFIAGFLFYHLSKNHFNYKDYLRKKFLYVIIPYLIVSIPALLDKFYFDEVGDHWWMDESFSQSSVPVKILFLLATGHHSGVFWFIPMITVIYLIAPAILYFARTKIFLYIVPIIVFLGLYTFRFGYYGTTMLSLQYFIPVYLFGIWVYRIKTWLFDYAYIIMVALGVIYVGMCIGEYLEWIPFNDTLGLRDVQYVVYQFNYNKLKMHIMCIFILLLFYSLPHKKIRSLKILGDYSFGIFFLHLYVIQVFRAIDRSGIIKISPPNIFTFVLYYLVVVLITVGIVKAIKIICRDKSRYVIGS